jgi:hypothetical protein
MKYGYQQKEAIYEEYEGTYANPTSKMVSKEYGWNHGLGELITALSTLGLKIEYLNEYEQSPYDIFPGLLKNDQGLYELPNGLYPLVFELKARKMN